VDLDLAGDGVISCVPEELNQVLTNLIQNAIEAVPEGVGRVRVTGRVPEDGQIEMRVADNGPGIPAEVREQIFTPFFTTKGPGKGMGLGLTITWRVVKALGGTIEVSSQVGEGTEFVVRLPRLAGRELANRSQVSASAAVPSA
jgi:signal transduction histidine kinase